MPEANENSFKEFLLTLQREWERKTLLDFLRNEIARQETESTRPGWNNWALFAAGAALVSYFLSALEPSGPNWKAVGILFIFLSIAAECTRYLSHQLHGKHEDPDQHRRFVLMHTEATVSRLFAIVILLKMLVLYVVYRLIDFGLEPFFSMGLVVFIWLNIFTVGTFLIISFLRLPFPKQLPSPKSLKKSRWWVLAALNLLWIGSGITAFIGILGRLNTVSPTVQDWRVAATLVGLSLIVAFLSQIRQTPALLEDLKGVERRLALGQITLPEAQEKADRILHGLTISDVMEPQVRAALHSLDVLESEHKEYTAQIEAFREAFRETFGDPGGAQSPEQSKTVYDLLLRVNKHSDDVLKAQQDAKAALQKLKKREIILKGMAPYMAYEIAGFMKEIQSALSIVDDASTQSKDALQQIVEQVNNAREQPNKNIDSKKE